MLYLKKFESFRNYDFFINESILTATPQFLEIIFNISIRGNAIAKNLLNIINRDVETNINLIDLGDKNDEIKFVNDSQLSTSRQPAQNIAKIGRSIRRLLELNGFYFSDQEITNFVNLYKLEYDQKLSKKDNFEIVEGEELRKWYLEENYVPGGGQLNNSCMRYQESQKYFDIYCDNPEVCKLIILKDDRNKLLGRALIWKLRNQIGDSEWYLDRIYTRFDHESDKFHNFFQEWSNSYDYAYFGGQLHNISVQLDKWKYKFYPYMDTFKLLDYDKGILKTYLDFSSKETLIELEDTKGGYHYKGKYFQGEEEFSL